MAQTEEPPWCDCKVAFDTTSGLDIVDAAFDLPEGWEVDQADGSGARVVIVFRVNGPLRVEDGVSILKQIQKIDR